MKQLPTITRDGFDPISQALAFFHVPGLTKWLHFNYDIGLATVSYRLMVMRSRGNEQASYFSDLDAAIEAYNDVRD